MSEPFSELGDAINDQRYVDVDLALRRGTHVDRDDADWYAYLLDAQAVLEPFYRRYGCELVHRSDGYFFLLPTGDKVGKRLLGLPEMIVGQGAALLYLDPRTIESGGVTTKDDLLSHLAAVMGTDTLVGVFNPKRKRMDERVAQETVRQRVAEGLRKLAQLGFITVSEDGRILLRSALMRFADPVRGAGSPRDALEKLIARGEVSLPGQSNEDAPDDDVRGDDYNAGPNEETPLGVERPTPSVSGASDFDADTDDADTALDEDDDADDIDGFESATFDERGELISELDVPHFDSAEYAKASPAAVFTSPSDDDLGADFDTPTSTPEPESGAPARRSARPRRVRPSDEGDVDLLRDSFATDFEEPSPPSSSLRPEDLRPKAEPTSDEGKPARKKRKRESIHPETSPEPRSRRGKVESSAESTKDASDEDTSDEGDFAPEGRSIPASALEPSFDEFD